MLKPVRAIFFFGILFTALITSGCDVLPLASPAPTAASTPLLVPSPTPVAPALQPTVPPSTATPTITRPANVVPTPTPNTFTLYIKPDQLWSIRYPANKFNLETSADGSITFRSTDKATWVVIDSYAAKGNEYGNTGEGLRNRARDTIVRVAGKQAGDPIPIKPTNNFWETGTTFTLPDGSVGEAVYAQPGRTENDFRVYGFIMGYVSASKQTVLPSLQSMRDSFLPVTVQSVNFPKGNTPLSLISSYGLRNFDVNVEAGHFVAVYPREPGAQAIAQIDLRNADYVDKKSVRQVQIEPSRLWITAESGVGAHGGCFELLSFDGQRLKSEVASCHTSPDAGSLRDLNGDGTPEVILNATENYVFCYACGVRFPQYTVLRWDSAEFVEVKLTPLPANTSAELARLTSRAVELAKGELWQEARTMIDPARTLAPQNATVVWDAALIRLHADARAEQAATGAYPLLDHLFNGDYPATLAVMRPYTTTQLFTLQSPLVVGTSAEGFENSLTYWITQTTTAAVQAKPDLATAYFVRGWGIYQTSPGSTKSLADVERAAQLNPAEPMFSSAASYLKTRVLPPLSSRERVQFAPGGTSAMLNLSLSPGVPRGFVLRVQANQKMSITAPGVDIAVLDAQDNGLNFGFSRRGEVNVVIPQTGDYTIVFFGQGNSQATISIPPR